MTIDSH